MPRALPGELRPVLHAGAWVYCRVPAGREPSGIVPLGTFREQEGLTLLLAEADAVAAGLPALFRAAWITLTVDSGLAAVGLTAAVARVLAAAGIPCNVVAAACHDHLFVPFERGEEALALLLALERRSGAEPEPPGTSPA